MSNWTPSRGGWVGPAIEPHLALAPDWRQLREWLRANRGWEATIPAVLRDYTEWDYRPPGRQVSGNHTEGGTTSALVADANPWPLLRSMRRQVHGPYGLTGIEQGGQYNNFWLGLWLTALLYLNAHPEVDRTPEGGELRQLLNIAISALCAIHVLHYLPDNGGICYSPGARRNQPESPVEGAIVEILAGRSRTDQWIDRQLWAASARLTREARHLMPSAITRAAWERLAGDNFGADRICAAMIRNVALRWPWVWERTAQGWWSWIVDQEPQTDPIDVVSVINGGGRIAIQPWPEDDPRANRGWPFAGDRLEIWEQSAVESAERPSAITVERTLPGHMRMTRVIYKPAGNSIRRYEFGPPVLVPPAPTPNPPPPSDLTTLDRVRHIRDHAQAEIDRAAGMRPGDTHNHIKDIRHHIDQIKQGGIYD